MSSATARFQLRQIPVLLGGDPDALKDWAARWETSRVLGYVAVIGAGAGLYGAAMGYWRSPDQAAYNLVKFPLLILTTGAGNALLNAMLAPLLGLDLGFRQSFMLVLMSFTMAAAILGSFAPIMFFIIWNTPSLAAQTEIPWVTYNFVQLTQVIMIAFAGVVANVRLLRLLRALSGSDLIARRVLFAWLAGNLFLGSQICWILRPFIGSPGLPVEFLRANAFHGNFYETVFRAIGHLLSS
ncbi:MAG: hypothetical protein E6L09_11090 [Verrucomicrobia bacterium]|nr:MAG: hypothetical protein E6L09_11090 [Verrucomicrobiota bacterium]